MYWPRLSSGLDTVVEALQQIGKVMRLALGMFAALFFAGDASDGTGPMRSARPDREAA